MKVGYPGNGVGKEEVGATDGFAVDGTGVGAAVDGAKVGLTEGWGEGTLVGFIVGLLVGEAVGGIYPGVGATAAPKILTVPLHCEFLKQPKCKLYV